MISVAEAKKIIQQHSTTFTPVITPLSTATGLVLAAAVYAGNNFPPFAQSAMDGYAFRFADWQAEHNLLISNESAAGNTERILLADNQAVRIFTGAPVPDGADTVIMQEKTATKDGQLLILDKKIQKGSNVRLEGSEIETGSLAMPKGGLLSAAAIGFLAGIGKTELLVYPKPSIAIIATGKELQKPGMPLQYGQVYESNTYTLSAALQQMHITNISIAWADDDLAIIETALQNAFATSDIVLITGGVSVGDYDFVATALANCGVEKLLHKIKQRPGKPLYVGKKEDRLVFGLPGNPSSVLTCFYEYVLPSIQKFMGKQHVGLIVNRLPLAVAYTKPAGLTHFLKGIVAGNEVMPLTGQESYRLHSFALANCLVVLEEEATEYAKGDLVEVHLF
ncbi:gephyrin-like molybdotransferase Glp [Parasediminibacterium sp. JCM 36343]|uniref:molybdopterin molybdotransferase MoeA n=1 Tax=Parasediminibacterium sp. JCM 36343 TaxID=3374279 RepID=UPI003978198E